MAKITATQDEAWNPDNAQDAVGARYIAPLQAQPTAWARVRAFLASPYLTLISRLALGGILFIAGLAKLGVPDTMADSIRAYEIPLPAFLVNIMSIGLPILEVGLGVWLLVGLFTRFSAALAAALMLVFTIAITQAWLRGLNIDCGCFGGPQGNPLGLGLVKALGPVGDYLSKEKADLATIARDVVFLLMGLHLMFVPTIFAVDNLRNR